MCWNQGLLAGRTGEQLKITIRNQPVEMVPTRQVGRWFSTTLNLYQALHFVLTRKLECILSLVADVSFDAGREVFNINPPVPLSTILKPA